MPGGGEALQYRSDIDGLRAIAVALVVLFHFGLPVPGGFVGVDVFFVISGYLITGIVIREIQAGSFSLLSFYDRRIRRIFPALFAVVVATLILGAFILLPGDYKMTGRSALWSSLSLANFFFYGNTGYFDPGAETMPLLHIWSLAVEEQFYILWPASLVLLARTFHSKRWPLVYACLAVLAASFACSIYLLQSNPKAAFFLPQSRAWELAVGAALTLLPVNVWTRLAPAAQPAGFTGLGLLLIGALLLTERAPFPGINALFPVLGAALIIPPWSRPTLVQRALSAAPLVFVGKISYSLYLWHWPVLVFWKHYIGGEDPSPLELAALFVIALALSYASWRWIEQPFRGRSRFSEFIVIPSGVAVASLCALLSWQVALRDSWPPPGAAAAAGVQGNHVEIPLRGHCLAGSGERPLHRGRQLGPRRNARHPVGRKSCRASPTARPPRGTASQHIDCARARVSADHSPGRCAAQGRHAALFGELRATQCRDRSDVARLARHHRGVAVLAAALWRLLLSGTGAPAHPRSRPQAGAGFDR
jgi:peptidoglycan/LPS O-acetylase OafA/YrhL